ncbi:MAG: tetratricopeptide repeat protein [Armatimonadota bacterium]|nr:tetratricopeptide repeat protein [Armatimonadota bacterium]
MTMRRCKCKAYLSDDAFYCSECGAPVRQPDEGPAGQVDVESLLASANLHRIRREWEEAIEQCTTALHNDPENPAAHVMLGDIYAAQDRLEDAVRWYEMALEIAPDNRAYAEKLESLRSNLAESYAHTDSSTARLGWFDRFVIGESFESSIRIITVTSAAFAALLIAAGLIALYSHKQPTVSATDVSQPGQGSMYQGDKRRPVVVESISPEQMPERAAYEISLLRQMNESQPVFSRRITVDDARVDPRHKILIVTFRNRSNGANRQETLLNAGAVAAAGFTMNSEIAYVTVRCVGAVFDTNGQSHLDLIFIADVARRSAIRLQPNATSEQITPALQSQWWNPLAK